VPFLTPDDMLVGEPLPGWSGRFFHAETMSFSHYDIAAGATPLHEHQHEQEEVWHVVSGQVALTIAGTECVLAAGSVAIVPPETPHSVRPLGACQVVVADYPLRPSLPGNPQRRPRPEEDGAA
jgi:mannose-6-phosphate isomerase-like protein (cupin superfamily)